jgi:hypothetical protein
MSESRKFSFRNLKWRCSLEFASDRIDYSWDEWGLGVEKGKKIIMRDQLSPHLAEANSFGRFRWPLLTASGYLILAMFAYALLPMPWRHATWLFLALFVLSAFTAIRRMRKSQWISILEKNGRSAVGVNVTGWSDNERKEFQTFYAIWIAAPKQLPDPTSPSVTPPSGVGGAPSVVADH